MDIDSFPAFPESREIFLEDKHIFDDFFKKHPQITSELTFTNIFSWRKIYKNKISRLNEHLIIFEEFGGKKTCLQPVGDDDGMSVVIKTCLDYLNNSGPGGVIERVGEDMVKKISDDGIFKIEEDRNNFDYVYSVNELINLSGDKFHDKKNLLNQFKRKYQYRYFSMTDSIIDRCIHFEHEWCEEKDCEKKEGLNKENCAVLEMLKNFKALNIKGGVIEVDGKFVAITMGERLNEDTFVVHIEKAKSSITGLYQAINNEFLKNEANEFKFVNREQDLGFEGLRKAKLSYNPVKMVKKYSIRLVTR